MKNTLIPLDMIFADVTGTVTRVHSNAIPGDTTPIDGGDGVAFVLEINGGLAGRLGIIPAQSFGILRLVRQRPGPVTAKGFSSPTFPVRRRCRGVAQSGSATVLGTVGREFESLRPDHSFACWCAVRSSQRSVPSGPRMCATCGSGLLRRHPRPISSVKGTRA